MKTISTKKIALLLSALFFAGSEASYANPVSSLDSKSNSSASSVAGKKKCGICEKYTSGEKIPAADAITIKAGENSYQPYLQFGGTRFFHLPESNAAGTVDLFVPIWQQDLTDLIFTDVRITDRSGTPFEGNIHLGYRHLFSESESQQSLGFYGAFDRKKTAYNNYFNQITVGGEYWIQNWFIGANYYQPIGNTTKLLSKIVSSVNPVFSDLELTNDLKHEKAMRGVDAEVGYEFIEGLVGYAGGYYFGASDTPTISGPRARLTYDLSLKNNGRILGIFDKVGLETGVQHDKPRGTVWYLSANVRVGWLPDKKSALEGVSRHMVDPVRRNIDVASGERIAHETKRIEKFGSFSRENLLAEISKHGTISPEALKQILDAYDRRQAEITEALKNENRIGDPVQTPAGGTSNKYEGKTKRDGSKQDKAAAPAADPVSGAGSTTPPPVAEEKRAKEVKNPEVKSEAKPDGGTPAADTGTAGKPDDAAKTEEKKPGASAAGTGTTTPPPVTGTSSTTEMPSVPPPAAGTGASTPKEKKSEQQPADATKTKQQLDLCETALKQAKSDDASNNESQCSDCFSKIVYDLEWKTGSNLVIDENKYSKQLLECDTAITLARSSDGLNNHGECSTCFEKIDYDLNWNVTV